MDFINEVLTSYVESIQNKEAVLSFVEQVMKKGKKKIPQELRDTTISEVKELEENFSQVIGFACK